MTTVADVTEKLALKLMTPKVSLSRSVNGGYAADLLSCVMARAKAGDVWVTLQAHPNVVAVASLLNLAAVIVTEDMPIEQPTIDKAEDVGMPILSSSLTTFSMVERLHELGIHGSD